MTSIHILEQLYLTERIQKVSNTILLLSEATDMETELVVKNQNLAHKLANDYYFTNKHVQVTKDECDSEAMLALYKAAQKYDPESGASFSTFAYTVIKNALNNFIVGRKRQVSRETTSGPNVDGMDADGTDGGFQDDDDDKNDDENWLGQGAATPDEEAIRNEERETMMQRISELPETQREALLRFWEGKNFSEIGEELGLTRAAVRQSIQAASKKLRVRLKHFTPSLA